MYQFKDQPTHNQFFHWYFFHSEMFTELFQFEKNVLIIFVQGNIFEPNLTQFNRKVEINK